MPKKYGVWRQSVVIKATPAASGVWGSFVVRSWRGGHGECLGATHPSHLCGFSCDARCEGCPQRWRPSDFWRAPGVGPFRLPERAPPLFGERLEQPVFANQIFRFLVIGQQAVYQFAPFLKDGSFLPNNRFHKTSYPLLYFRF